MKRLILGLAVSVSLTSPVLAQDKPIGWNTGVGGNIPLDAPVITTSLQPSLTAERNLSVVSADSAFLQWVDNGANAALELDFGICPLTNGGTGGATAQAGTNNLLDGCAGSAAASGDILYRNGSTWTRLARGSDGDILVLSSNLPTWSASLGASSLSYVTIGNTGSLTGERALTGTANRITFSDGGANGAVTADIGSDVVTLTGSQTLTNKLLTSPSVGTSLIFELGANDTTITATAPSSARALTIPDPGGDASFVMTEGAQTINGVKTMGSATRFNAEVQNSSGNTITLPSAAGTLSTLALTETLTNKTLTSPILGGTPVLKSTNQYNLTISNPAANRDYTVYDAGGSADFAMKSGTPTNQAVVIGDGSKMTFLTPGSSGQVLKMSGSNAAWGSDNSGGFGGDGNAGAVTKGAVTETTVTHVSATTYSQTASTTHSILSGSVINATSTATFSGTTTVGNLGNGQSAAPYGSASGPTQAVGSYGGSPIDCSNTTGPGGGGGGNGGAGGSGGDRSGGTANSGGRGGKAVALGDTGGGGAAGASEADAGSVGGAGGARGGKLTICAVGALSFGASSTVSANGAAAGAAGANGGGGGGGAGGVIIAASQTSVTVNSGATCTVTGGAGGAAGTANSGVGGGGGGGQWYSIAPSITHTSAPTAAGGAAGSGTGITTNSSAGGTGLVVSLTITPTLPLIGILEQDNNGMKQMLALARLHGKAPDAQGCWHVTGDEATGWLSAWNASNQKEQKEIAYAIQNGKQLDSHETCLLLKDDGNAEALRNAS